ncbi:TPA: hypothetical protein N0F65_011163 [Lagenidium giganteum]|uniref:Uncharacterized protein n=1 Tax=Lagenidium giganteum TaxID=4803 RepID=A0AAV2Z414_9STRA|nr:TPA: hypothetical protein N0F65_011163 [Lagenidium giganteum]
MVSVGHTTDHRRWNALFVGRLTFEKGGAMRLRYDCAVKRWLALFAGILSMLGVGSLYAISAWNAQLKVHLHYSQAGIATVSSLAVMGPYLSYLPGVVFDRIGVSKALVAGAGGLGVLHLFLWVALVYCPTRVSPLVVGVTYLLVGVFGAFYVISSLITLEGVFGDANRGKVMATLMSAYSCGGAVFAFVVHHFFDDNVPGYFLFLSVFLVASGVFAWSLFSPRKAREECTRLSPKSVNDRSADNAAAVVAATTEDLDDVTGVQLLTCPRFWLLFTAVLIVIGAGLFVMSNVSFIVESLHGPMDQVPIMIALFSVGNTSARVLTGVASDHVIATCPRAYFGAFAAAATVLTQLLFLVIPRGWLAVPVLCAGLAEGVMFGTFPVIVREAFGVEHFGKNFGLVSIANAVGFPLVLNPFATVFYHRGAEVVNGVEKCFGEDCYRPVFLLVIALCAVAAACCAKLARIQNRRRNYRHVPV